MLQVPTTSVPRLGLPDSIAYDFFLASLPHQRMENVPPCIGFKESIQD